MVDISNEAVERRIKEQLKANPKYRKEILEELIHKLMWEKAFSQLCDLDYR